VAVQLPSREDALAEATLGIDKKTLGTTVERQFCNGPLRTPRESFNPTRRTGDRCRDGAPRGAFTVDCLVALLTGHRGLAPT
jgi:hypothetical protein